MRFADGLLYNSLNKRGKVNQGKNDRDHMLIVEVLILFELVLIPFYLLSELYLKSRYGNHLEYYLTKAKFLHAVNVVIIVLIVFSFFELLFGVVWQPIVLKSLENTHPLVTLVVSSVIGGLFVLVFYSLDQRASHRLINPMKVLSENLMLLGEGNLNISIPNYEDFHTSHEINLAIEYLNQAIERISKIFNILLINTRKTERILDKTTELYSTYEEFLGDSLKTIEEESHILKSFLQDFAETKNAMLDQFAEYIKFIEPLKGYLEEFKATSDETWITTLNAQIESINIESSQGTTFSVVASKMQDVYKDIQRVFEQMSTVIEQALKMSYTLEREFTQSIQMLEEKSTQLMNPNKQVNQLVNQLIERQRLVLDKISEMKAMQKKMLTSTSWFKDQNLHELSLETNL